MSSVQINYQIPPKIKTAPRDLLQMLELGNFNTDSPIIQEVPKNFDKLRLYCQMVITISFVMKITREQPQKYWVINRGKKQNLRKFPYSLAKKNTFALYFRRSNKQSHFEKSLLFKDLKYFLFISLSKYSRIM